LFDNVLVNKVMAKVEKGNNPAVIFRKVPDIWWLARDDG
jgi:hypothetical protein